MIDLSSYSAIETALLVKWTIPDAGTEYLTDYNSPITFGGNTYSNIGNLLSVSGFMHEIKASASRLTIGLSGIPSGAITDILSNEIKGSNIEIYRAFYNATTHTLLDLSPASNPVSKFKGIVDAFSIEDDVDNAALTASSSITLTCNSIVEVLSKKISGRRTNSQDFLSEQSMNRVAVLSRSTFQFGGNQ